jgi:DNA-binding transcriptional LysR family regulator
MFDDLRALVEFARAGSIAGAADRLYRTRSAITATAKAGGCIGC